MRRTADSYKKTDLFGLGKHGWTDGVPNVEAPTIAHAADMNHHQEELSGIVERVGLTDVDSTNYYQVASAINLARVRDACVTMTATTLTNTTKNVFDFVSTDGATTSSSYVLYCAQTGATSVRNPDWTDAGSWGAHLTAGSSYAGDFRSADVWSNTWIVAGTNGEIQTATIGTSPSWTERKTGGNTILSVKVKNNLVLQALAADTAGHVWRATSSTGSWSDLGAVLPATGGGIHLAYAPDLDMWAASCRTSGVYTSTDNGSTWTQHTFATMDFKSVTWCGASKRWIATGTQAGTDGMAFSSPDGVTWTQVFWGNPSQDSLEFLTECPGGVVALMRDPSSLESCWVSHEGKYWHRLFDLPSTHSTTALKWVKFANKWGQLHIATNVSGTPGNIFVSRRISDVANY